MKIVFPLARCGHYNLRGGKGKMKKKVTVTIGRLETAAPIIGRLYQANFKDIKAAYALGRNSGILQKELDLAADIRQKLVMESAQKDEAGGVVMSDKPGMVALSPEKKDEFWNKYNELMAQEVEMELWVISFDALQTALEKSGGTISPRDLAAIEFLIDPDSFPKEDFPSPVPGDFN